MISEYFVDVCVKVCCAVIPITCRQQKDLFENIKLIIEWYKKEIPEDTRPIEFRDKIDILFWLSSYRKDNSFDFSIMMAKLSEWRLGHFAEILHVLRSEFTEEQFLDTFKMVVNRRKLCDVIKGKTELQQLLSDIDSCSLTDDEEVLAKWEKQLQTAHDDLLKIKKIESTDSASSLDVTNDSYTAMFSTMMDSIEESKILKTGFNYLKQMLVSGGFENRRLYLIGGSSGVGKSAMLINLICNAIKSNTSELAAPPNTYLYITAENLIDETWIRFYCCLTGIPHQRFMDNLKNVKSRSAMWAEQHDAAGAKQQLEDEYARVKSEVMTHLNKQKANVIFKYVPSGVSTTRDILAIVDSVSREHNLRAVFIDYLDLFSSGRNLELRFELALISQALKNIAIDYNIPVITATQLNREGYNPDGEPKLTQMGESMEKVNKSDFVLFLQEARPKTFDVEGTTYRQVRMTVLKQRNGKTGDSTIIAMPSSRGTNSVFNFRFEERENPTLVQEQKEVKRQGRPIFETAPSVPSQNFEYNTQEFFGPA